MSWIRIRISDISTDQDPDAKIPKIDSDPRQMRVRNTGEVKVEPKHIFKICIGMTV